MLRDFRGDLARALPGSRAIQVPTHRYHGQQMGSEMLAGVGGIDIGSPWQLEARWDA